MPDQREQQNQQGGKGERQQGGSQKDDQQRRQPNQKKEPGLGEGVQAQPGKVRSGPILDRRSKGGGTISRAAASRPVNNRTANLSDGEPPLGPATGPRIWSRG
jgi:hypothetical protein